jgi:hypothetical protein
MNHEIGVASQVEVETPYSYALLEAKTGPSLTQRSCVRRRRSRDQYAVVTTQGLIEKNVENTSPQ